MGMKPRSNAPPDFSIELGVSNLRCIGAGADPRKDVPRVRLGPLSLLLGPNGTGKSTLLDALDLLARAGSAHERLPSMLDRMGGFEDLVYRQDAGREIGLHLHVPRLQCRYDVVLAWARDGVAVRMDRLVSRKHVLLDRRADRVWVHDSREGEAVDFGLSKDVLAVGEIPDDPERFPEVVRFRAFLRRVQLFRLSAAACRAAGKKPSKRIERDGTGLAELALHLFQTHKRAWRDISDFVAEAVPGVTGIEPILGADQRLVLHARLRGLERPVPAPLLSDGTMLMLAVACLCFDPDPPTVIMLEEPDHGVHARMQELIMQALRAASRRTTVIATTHSTGMLAQVRTLDDIVLTEATPKGTRFVRRSAAKDLQDWIDEHGLASAYEIGLLGGVR